MKAGWVLSFVLAIVTAAHAELPPSAYEAKQKAAQEQLTIQILRVNIEPGQDEGSQNVEVLARVEAVNRSVAKVKPQDMITITYTVNHRPIKWVGPGEVPILEEGRTTVAYLNPIPDSSNYCPAAGRMSFSNF